MKNSLVLKFIAVLLCAAALLGIIASGLGMFVMSEAGLYNKSVEQLRQERIAQECEALARKEAMYYCGKTMGGCPEELLEKLYAHYSNLNFDHVGYAIKDAEGQVVAGYGNLTAQRAKEVYTFPASGKYAYLVSAEPVSHQEIQQLTARQPEAISVIDGSYSYYSAIPASGVTIWEVELECEYNGTICFSIIGTAFTASDGTVYVRFANLGGFDTIGEIYRAELLGPEGTVFQAGSTEAIGVGALVDGDLVLQFYPAVGLVQPEPAEETVPETTQETLPETTEPPVVTEATVPQTMPEETDSTEETWTQPEGTEDASSASALPEDETVQAETVAPETVPVTTAPPTTAPAETEPAGTESAQTGPAVTEPVMIAGKNLKTYDIQRTTYQDNALGEKVNAQYVLLPMPELTVEVYTEDGAVDATMYSALAMLQPYRNQLFALLGISFLVLAVCVVYLCAAAGHKAGRQEIRAGGLNCLSLDVYSLVVLLGWVAAVAVGEGLYDLMRQSLAVAAAAAVSACFAACLLTVGFGFALAAQVKTPGGYWWRNLLTVRAIFLTLGCIAWLWRTLRDRTLPWLGKLLRGVFQWLGSFGGALMTVLSRWSATFFRWLWEKLHVMISMLGVTWQWLLGGVALLALPTIGLASGSETFLTLALIADAALIIYGANCFGQLLESTKRMGKGDLNIQVDESTMQGAFREFAQGLNGLAGVAVVAAKKQLKSERMKTELITNVSHDIKTPLTSIINYVDLLQKPHTDQEEQQYLEVLNRQSLRLKKLIDDLMEMSKASTGNMSVELETVDAVESVNQALGEFADKLARAKLVPMFRHSQENVFMQADGKLVWRVLSNLLTNAVKYAMPGTRLYIDLMEAEGKVLLSLKNISREQLNIDSDELMERFVRGDGSRNTEGSGLGLNIAKSLMELQGGELQLLVDGDLFKVTLVFPGAKGI